MRLYKYVLSAFLFSTSLNLIGQDFEYARLVVDKLASDEFKGRGYVDNGDALAAGFIQEEFERIGLKTFKKSYFQKFDIPVNSFPASMDLKLNNVSLIAGVDFIIEPGSPGVKGEFEVLKITIEDCLNLDLLSNKLKSSAEKFIAIPEYDRSEYDEEQLKQINDVINFIKYHPDNPASGSVIFTNERLTWSGSTTVNPKPSFTINSVKSFESIESITLNAKNEFIAKHETQNVVGYLEGTSSDSLLVFISHYDHLGMMGSETIFPGANDNASGVAMLLNLAKYYKQNKPKYNTVFIAFAGEELGLLGAKYFVEKPLFDLNKIKFLINFDISGTGDDGIQVVNGKLYRDQFNRLRNINNDFNLLKQVKIRGEACNSDHCMFHSKGVPCFFIYTLGGIQAYHDVYDKAETLPLTEFNNYFKLITMFSDGL